MRIRSFRLRLTVWHVSFFSLLFVLFAVFLYGVLARALVRQLDSTLVAEAATAANLFQDEMGEMHGDALRAAPEALAGLRLHAGAAAIFDGTKILAIIPQSAVHEFDAVVAHVPQPLESDRLFTLPDRHVAVQPAMVDSRAYAVIAMERLDGVAASLEIVRRVLLFGLPLMLAIAALGGYWLTSRSLAPLGRMAEQASQITSQSLHTRLDAGAAAKELETLAASFNELLSRLDQSFESMRRFVADASHELRTPLSVIRGEADVALSQDRKPSDYRQSLALILDESRRLSRLVEDLLNLARADAGHVRLRVEEFYFNDLISECCRSAEPLASARGVRLWCHSPGDLSFHGDEALIRRLVMNLLDNAIRYTPEGGQVSVSVEPEDVGMRLRVADTGIGIAPDAAPHVFERFYRGDKARSRQDGGFGLGLSIVKWIAESHRGEVELETRPESGSTFIVTLPR